MNSSTVSPTRQELMRLKMRVKNAKRGYKLLKDKRDSLMQLFMQTYKEAIQLRKQVDQDFSDIYSRFVMSTLEMDSEYVELLATDSEMQVELHSETQNMLGVKIPKIESVVSGNFLNYSMLETNVHLDVALKGLSDKLGLITELIGSEYKLRKLAQEIEKTRFRVNALEHKIIPEFNSQIAYIRGKLEENARQSTVRLLKMKEKMS